MWVCGSTSTFRYNHVIPLLTVSAEVVYMSCDNGLDWSNELSVFLITNTTPVIM